VKTVKSSSKSFTNLFDFYNPPLSSSVISHNIAVHQEPLIRESLPAVSSNSFQVPNALNFPPSLFQMSREEDVRRSLLRTGSTKSNRRRRVHGSADVTSQLRPQFPDTPNFPPGAFQMSREEHARRSLLRSRSERRWGLQGSADATSLLRPLLLVQTYEAGARETGASSPPYSASAVMETRKDSLCSVCASVTACVLTADRSNSFH